MSKLYVAALVLGAIGGSTLLASVGCATSSPQEVTGTALGELGEDGGAGRGSLVISAVFPYGGRTGAPFKSDYVEILNKSTKEVDLAGGSIQLSATTGTTTFSKVVPLTGKVGAGKYFLVELGSNGGNGADLPTPDQAAEASTPSIAQNTTGAREAGKVALAIGVEPLNCGQNGVACPNARVLDLVGWGETSAWEGAASAAKPTDYTKAFARAGSGCTDTENNSRDIALADPDPRNTSEAAIECNPPKPDAGVDARTPDPIDEPPLGEEPDFDGGVRRDAGGSSPPSGGADDSGCAVSAPGGLDTNFGALPLTGLALGIAYAIRRRRRA